MRTNVQFVTGNQVAIKPLLDKLSFISDPTRWEFIFRRGFFEINEQDFCLIAQGMKVRVHEK